jgi:hypothetical protein
MNARRLHRLTAKGAQALGVGQHCDGGSLYLFKSTPHSGSWVFRYSGKNMGLGSMAVVSLAERTACGRHLRGRVLSAGPAHQGCGMAQPDLPDCDRAVCNA